MQRTSRAQRSFELIFVPWRDGFLRDCRNGSERWRGVPRGGGVRWSFGGRGARPSGWGSQGGSWPRVAVAVFPFGAQWSKGKLEVTVLDVGQGDSLFIVSPGGKTMLIDGGGAFGGSPGREEHQGVDPGEEAVSPYLWSRGFQKLDAVGLTDAHQDQLG